MSGWIDRVSAVLYAWYPGQEGSRALVDALRGKYNPAGRLPISFPEQIAQVPIHYDSEPRGRNSGYHDLSDQPLFEFGYGLSYTAFSYGALTLSSLNISAGETCTARITVDVYKRQLLHRAMNSVKSVTFGVARYSFVFSREQSSTKEYLIILRNCPMPADIRSGDGSKGVTVAVIKYCCAFRSSMSPASKSSLSWKPVRKSSVS